MAITKDGAEKVEEQSQQEPVPSSDQKVPETTDASSVGESEAQETTEVSSELPDEAKERTKREFDKLKKQLKDERQKRINLENSKSPQQTQEEDKPLYDPKTGLVDIEELERTRKLAKEAVRLADEAKKGVHDTFQATQEREALGAYPELDPQSDNFDEELHRQTRAYLLDSMAYPESYSGRQLTYKEAADMAKGNPTKETPEQEADRLGPKEEASLGTSGRPTQAVQRQASEQDLRALQVGTRKGDKDAQIARLRAIREASQSQ